MKRKREPTYFCTWGIFVGLEEEMQLSGSEIGI